MTRWTSWIWRGILAELDLFSWAIRWQLGAGLRLIDDGQHIHEVPLHLAYTGLTAPVLLEPPDRLVLKKELNDRDISCMRTLRQYAVVAPYVVGRVVRPDQ
ncbi:hypothetical protein QJS04_geneDACA000126 [Acorus gramineus]|uniref:Uncharacterized protein n=1 Tax=Acorus gramineus TaxID=55184 RepID=A0AAV9ATV2_ACOGR|nr:hypothetical protein QJS04_geneDACA000126 [Acorus gramineus]